MVKAKIEIDATRCKGCGYCVQFCPHNLIYLDTNFNSRGYHPAVFNEEKSFLCTGCGICALVCPDTAITVYKKKREER
ncbi:4Fe-4S dicluster domain-containing protein [Candidatus Aerophobetes bacterium]|nr:4Fe-4S dicluster domain-containing protein [Candidatus Aerophobetes bacterium]